MLKIKERATFSAGFKVNVKVRFRVRVMFITSYKP